MSVKCFWCREIKPRRYWLQDGPLRRTLCSMACKTILRGSLATRRIYHEAGYHAADTTGHSIFATGERP
jgi:hypothetical protein